MDGGYSDWQPWNPCSGFCGSGLQSRSRSCTNPEPAYDGAGCSGPSEEIQDCQHSQACSGLYKRFEYIDSFKRDKVCRNLT